MSAAQSNTVTIDSIWNSVAPEIPTAIQVSKRKCSSSTSLPASPTPSSSPDPCLAQLVSLMTKLSNDVLDVKACLSDNRATMDNQFSTMKNEFANLSSTVLNLSKKQFELSKENEELKSDVAIMKVQIAELKRKDAERNKEVAEEVFARDELEAQQRRYNLVVSGIVKVDEDEDCKAIANAFFVKLLPSYQRRSLDICHRTASGSLICRFVTRSARDSIFALRKTLKDRTTSDFGLPNNDIKNKIYINESLTFLRSRIFREAKSACQEYNTAHPTAKYKVIIHKGLVKAVDPNEKKKFSDRLTTFKTVDSISELFE